MNKQEFINELEWRFNLNLTPSGEKTLNEMLDKYKPVIEVIKKVPTPVYVKVDTDNPTDVYWKGLIEEACEKFQIDYNTITKPSRYKRSTKHTKALCFLCRKAKTDFPKTTARWLMGKLNIARHCTIYVYWYALKIDCGVERLPTKYYRSKKFQSGYFERLKKVA